MEAELPNPEELEEIKGKKFTRKVALVTAVFAVVLAIASLSANHAMKETLLAQQQASDQWAFYQAKSIREHLYKSQETMLKDQLDLMSGSLSPQSAEKVRASIKALADQGSQYANEKKEIGEEARKLEKERDANRSRDPYFEYAEVLLQIAIVMASVSIIAVSRAVFAFSILVASLGALMYADGYLHIFVLPFLQ